MFVPTTHCRYCVFEDRVVLLNLQTGRYHQLDAVASRIWTLATTSTPESAIVEELQQEFSIDRSIAARDVVAFLDTCVESSLLGSDEMHSYYQQKPVRTPVAMQRMTLFLAIRNLLEARRGLRVAGFPAVYSRQQRLAPARNDTVAKFSLDRALRVFSNAENFFSVRDARLDCLPRSLALHRFLLSLGFEVSHNLGVRRYPFAAHAWVEYAGAPLCDTPEFVSQFKLIAMM